MKNVYLIILAACIALLAFNMMRPKSYLPPKYIQDGFIGLCPPGQMPASYTAAGGDCTPYRF
jgi:hypothetical protein